MSFNFRQKEIEGDREVSLLSDTTPPEGVICETSANDDSQGEKRSSETASVPTSIYDSTTSCLCHESPTEQTEMKS